MKQQFTIRVKYVDNTTSYSGGGSSGGHSGGGGGGGGSHGGGGGGKVTTGVGPSGSKTTTSNGLPTYVVSGGTWALNAAGKWIYTNGRTYTDDGQPFIIRTQILPRARKNLTGSTSVKTAPCQPDGTRKQTAIRTT